MRQTLRPAISPRLRSRGVRVALLLFATLVAAATVILGVIGWIGSERALHPANHGYTWSLADYSELVPQTVSFPSRTGIRIAGRFFPGAGRKTIVLSHGYGDNQDQDLPFAAFLHRDGFNVLTYNMRARATSGGSDVTLGALEQYDLLSAIDYLTTRHDIDPALIGGWGISLGGATTILAAARDRRMRAVVDDSGFSDAPRVIAASFETFIHLPAFPFAPITVAIAQLRAGVNIVSVRPVDVVARIAPRPLLIIHCRGDQVVTPDNSGRIYRAAGPGKQIWWIPGGGHGNGHTIRRAEYERRVSAFFNDALGSTPDP